MWFRFMQWLLVASGHFVDLTEAHYQRIKVGWWRNGSVEYFMSSLFLYYVVFVSLCISLANVFLFILSVLQIYFISYVNFIINVADVL